jgi:signal transduction histidine kinase
MRLRIVLLFALCLLCSRTLFGQHQYNIEYITTENGLPSDGIKGLQIDEKMGFLWIATESGLVRYNGHQHTLFNSDNFPYLIPDKIFPLIKTPAGGIYGVTRRFIYKVDNNRIVPLQQDEVHNKDVINVYLKDGPHKRDNPGVNDFDRFLPVNESLCYVERNDTLYELRSGMHQKKIVMPLPHKCFTFVTNGSVFIYDNNNNRFNIADVSNNILKPVAIEQYATNWTNADKIHLYWEPGMDNMIALSGTNAWEIQYENGKLHPRLICNEIPQNSNIRHIRFWRQANILFLGTTSKGLFVIRKNYLSNIKKNKSGFDEPNAFYSQILLPSGNILINTGDVLGPYPATDKKLPIEGPFNNNIFVTRDSLLWYSFRDSLYYYDYTTHERKFRSPLPGSYNIAFATSAGNTYMANNRGIYRLSREHIDTEASYKDVGDPFDMVELKPGILVMATSKGVFKFSISTHRIDTVLFTAAPARTLWRYEEYLFIGTYGDGIYIYKDGKLKKIPLDNNHYLNYTHCFILDANGYCWMSTNRGLFKAKLTDMINAYEKGIEYIYYHFFGRNDGMDITEMNGGCTPCAIWLANKQISFPTMDGAVWVDPYIPAHMPDSNIFIDQIIVNGKKVDSLFKDSLFFDSKTNDISFNLGFSAWCDKENLYLQYKVAPYSDKWEKIDALHPVIRLNNLPSGQYKLYIRKLTGFGSDNYVTRTFGFEIQAPWYMRWWGQALIIFVFMVIVAIISILANRSSLRRQIRLRSLLDKKTEEILEQNEKLEKNDRIKTRLISIISHDIITPLKFLHMTSKYLAERKSSLSDTMQAETLEEVVNTSRELELLSTNILNWIKYQNEERRIVKEKVNLHEVVEQVFTVLVSLAHKNKIELVNNIPADLQLVQFVDPLRIIIYNLVVNAINFTRQGSITVACDTFDNLVQVKVKDTGMGMSRSQINNLKSDMMIISGTNVNKRSGNGLGYLIIKDLLKMLNGTFDIESKLNEGTTVSITFPVR